MHIYYHLTSFGKDSILLKNILSYKTNIIYKLCSISSPNENCFPLKDFFWNTKEEKCFVHGLCESKKNIARGNKVTCRKTKNYEPKALMKRCCLWSKKKSLTITISTPIITKGKEWRHEKKMSPTQEARKSKKFLKNRRKVKGKKIN